MGDLLLQREAYLTLTALDSAKNDFIRALGDYKNYIIIRDSISNDKKKKEIEHISMQYEFDKKKDSLNLQQQVTDEKLKQQVLLAKQQQQQFPRGPLWIQNNNNTSGHRLPNINKIAAIAPCLGFVSSSVGCPVWRLPPLARSLITISTLR